MKGFKKKLLEIVKHPEHCKPLKNVMAGYVRVHFGSFVLVYKIEGDTVKIVYIGLMDNKKGQPTKMFDVFKDEPEAQPESQTE